MAPSIHKCNARDLPRCALQFSTVSDRRCNRGAKSWIAIIVGIVGLTHWPHYAATAQTNRGPDPVTQIAPSVREALSNLQKRPSLYAVGMSEDDLGGKTAKASVGDQNILFGQSLALAQEDRLGVSPYFVLRALKEAAWKPYPLVNRAVENWIQLARRILTAKTSVDFANLGNIEERKTQAGKTFHDAIVEVVITEHVDEPVDQRTQLGQFIAAMEDSIAGIEKARVDQGLVPLKPIPQMAIESSNRQRSTRTSLLGTDVPNEGLLPWRKIQILNDPNTQLVVEGAMGREHRIPGGVRSHFLNGEKAGPAVNVCRAQESGRNIFIRCDRKGGFRDGPQPRPWWWRYEAFIEGSTIRIVSVSQKDGPLERGERVSDHFHEEIEEGNAR